jgi:type IV secretory pathway VirB10-like protein
MKNFVDYTSGKCFASARVASPRLNRLSYAVLCKKTNDDAAKCANCGVAHTASYRGCPKFPRGFQTKKSSGPAAPKPQQKPAAAPRNNPPPPADPVTPSAPKTGPETKTATNNNASKSFADAAATKKTAPATLLQATPKQSVKP